MGSVTPVQSDTGDSEMITGQGGTQKARCSQDSLPVLVYHWKAAPYERF